MAVQATIHMNCSLKSAILRVLLLFLIQTQSFQGLFLERLNFNINSMPLKDTFLLFTFKYSHLLHSNYQFLHPYSCSTFRNPLCRIKIIPVPAQPPKNTNNGSLMMVASKQLPWNLWIVFLWTILLSFPVFPISKFAISTF